MTRIGSIGKVNVLTSSFPVAYYVSLALIHPNELDSFYLKYYIESDSIQKQLWKRTLHIAFPQKINKNDISKVPIKYPNNEEQIFIGKFLNKVETTISIQERKLTLLHKMIDGISREIIKTKYENPSIYLKNKIQLWNLTSIKRIGNIVTGNTPSTNNQIYYSNNGKPWVTPADLSTDNLPITSFSKKLTDEGWNASRHLPKGSILITCIGSIGKNGLTKSDTAFNQQINGLIPDKEHDSYFLLKLSQIWSKEMLRIAGQSTLPIVNKTEFSKLNTYLPTNEIEKILGNFFFALDTYLQKEYKKLYHLKKIKKFLLKNMFI